MTTGILQDWRVNRCSLKGRLLMLAYRLVTGLSAATDLRSVGAPRLCWLSDYDRVDAECGDSSIGEN